MSLIWLRESFVRTKRKCEGSRKTAPVDRHCRVVSLRIIAVRRNSSGDRDRDEQPEAIQRRVPVSLPKIYSPSAHLFPRVSCKSHRQAGRFWNSRHQPAREPCNARHVAMIYEITRDLFCSRAAESSIKYSTRKNNGLFFLSFLFFFFRFSLL